MLFRSVFVCVSVCLCVCLGVCLCDCFFLCVCVSECVMCKSQVEAARQERDDYDVAGLNKGIVYMMTVPYILIGAVGFFWYRRTHPKVAKS